MKKAETNTKNKSNSISKINHSFIPGRKESVKSDMDQIIKDIHEIKLEALINRTYR